MSMSNMRCQHSVCYKKKREKEKYTYINTFKFSMKIVSDMIQELKLE